MKRHLTSVVTAFTLLIASSALAATYSGFVTAKALPSQMIRYEFTAAPHEPTHFKVTGRGGDIDCYVYTHQGDARLQIVGRDTTARDGCDITVPARPTMTSYFMVVQNSSDRTEVFTLLIN